MRRQSSYPTSTWPPVEAAGSATPTCSATGPFSTSTPRTTRRGCTLEGREFTRLLPEFERAGVAVYGVSPDSGESHDAFAAKCELGIPLVSDPDRRLIGFLQLWVTKSKYGREYMGVDRSTFLIGPDGRIAREWRTVKPEGHADEVLAAVRGGADPA